MLTSLNRLVGMPVVWQDRKLGCVERGVTDPRALRLMGVVVRRGIGAARWIPSEALLLVGWRCVLARQKPEPIPDELPQEASEVFMTTGERVGLVSDGLLGGDSLKMRALEISAGPVCRLMGNTSYAVDYHVLHTRDGRAQVVVPGLLSKAEFQRRLREEENG